MQQKYKVPRLTSSTPEKDQKKLTSALKAVKGVDSIKLHTASGEVEISSKGDMSPKRSDIIAACQKAGFEVKGAPGKRSAGK